MRRRDYHKFPVAAIRAWYFSNVAVVGVGIRYLRAAQRDERDGYGYTAAFEWRQAAEALVAYASTAEYCWRRWERLMRLPRQLAGPLPTTHRAPTSSSCRNQQFWPAIPSAQVVAANL